MWVKSFGKRWVTISAVHALALTAVFTLLYLLLATRTLHADPQVIYGEDDRRDIYQVTDTIQLERAQSVALMVESKQLTANPDGTFTLTTKPFEFVPGGIGLEDLCPTEPFYEQPTVSGGEFCTGFRMGQDVFATAAHCFSDVPLSNKRVVFGFHQTAADTTTLTFAANQVYTPTEYLINSPDDDYAIVRLDRPVTAPGAAILPLRATGSVPSGTAVGIIGYPVGLPLKVAFGEATQVYTSSDSLFYSNVDSYVGNSGSPVFDTAGTVVGILLSGATDFEPQDPTPFSCWVSRRLDNGVAGEAAVHTSLFATDLAVTATPSRPTAAPGTRLTYTLDLQASSGLLQLTNIVLTSTIPTGTTYVPGSATDGGTLGPDGTLRWSVGAMNPGESRVVSFQVQVTADAPPLFAPLVYADTDYGRFVGQAAAVHLITPAYLPLFVYDLK